MFVTFAKRGEIKHQFRTSQFNFGSVSCVVSVGTRHISRCRDTDLGTIGIHCSRSERYDTDILGEWAEWGPGKSFLRDTWKKRGLHRQRREIHTSFYLANSKSLATFTTVSVRFNKVRLRQAGTAVSDRGGGGKTENTGQQWRKGSHTHGRDLSSSSV